MHEMVLRQQKESTMVMSAKRHFHSFIKYMTIKKAINIFVSIFEMSLKRSFLFSHPFYMRIEVCPHCNLHCTGCLLGGANLVESNPSHRKEKVMSLALFKDSIRDFLPYLVKVNLYDEGEPLLNKNIPKMVDHLHRNKIATCISSNFSFKITDEYMKELLSCGLDRLIVAIDGATQESYAEYRKGGDLSLVVSNLERLISMKKRIDSSLQIELQFLEFPHNKNDRDTLRDLAIRLGVERFSVIEDCSTEGWEGKRFEGTEEERRQRGCYYLWVATTSPFKVGDKLLKC